MKFLILYIIAALPLIGVRAYHHNNTMVIEQVPNLEDIPNNEIRRLYQDSDGFIWIATTGGLYQFDGYNLNEYRANIYNPGMLTSNNIMCMFESSDNKLYVGTNFGLNIYDKRTGKFSVIKDAVFKNNNIIDIIEVNPHELWLGTQKGIFVLNTHQNKFKKIFDRDVKSFLIDSQKNIWVGTWNKGLYRYDQNNHDWIKYPKFNKKNSVHFIFEDSRHRIWLGSFGCGITLLHNQYDMDHLSWTNFTANDKDNRITDNHIYAIAENESMGTLLFGTRKGLSILNVDDDSMQWYNIFAGSSLPFNEVDAIINDKQDNIWLGTLGGGIYYIKTKNSDFHTNLLEDVQHTLHSNTIKSICIDSSNRIWTGIGTNGLSFIENGKTNMLPSIMNEKSESFTRIHSIVESATDNIIILGTQSGLYYYQKGTEYERKYPYKYYHTGRNEMPIVQIVPSGHNGFWMTGTNHVSHITHDLKKRHDLNIEKDEYSTVVQTSPNTVWIGTQSNGIIRITYSHHDFAIQNISRYNTDNGKAPTQNIIHLYLDSKKRIWAATDGAGLCQYNKATDRFESVNTMTDFPTDVVTSITQDAEGTLWLGSNIGLIRFYPQQDMSKSTFRLYNKSNGLPDNQFLPRAVTQSENGEIYFGTHHGYVHFFPKEIHTRQKKNDVFITDFKINSRSVEAEETPGYAKQLTVPGNKSNFTIEFSPMTFTAPEKVRYAYQLEGYDKEWQFTGTDKRFAHYTNLSAGEYLFRLKCTDEYGIWNDTIKKVKVVIEPPFYRTGWAYSLYSVIIALIFLYIFRSAHQKIRLRTAMHIQEIEKEKSDELNQAKLRFFTNITHELFTPITIIAAAIEDSKRLIPEKEYNIISTNTNRLVRLIQQILEFRKAETGNLKLQVAKQDLKEFVAKNIESFIPLMKQKNITASLKCEKQDVYAYFDSDKIDKILCNLLSNGLKYNAAGAHIQVSLKTDETDTHATIEVRDNGKGLSEKTMKNLFKRFYDGDFRKFKTAGTGIGLSLVKDLITLHKGTIEVDNHPGEGVAFIITLPICADAYTQEECNDNQQDNDLLPETIETENENEEKNKNYNLLVVEDNPDLILLLRNVLSRKYNIFTAENGKEALEILKAQDIQLLISDVMMPVMNGYELCKAVKGNIEFSHIPILLLTAKTTDEDAVDAYEAGADSYLKKPFSISVLNARITNLLQARENLAQKFKNQATFNPKELDYSTPDEEFIKQVMECIYSNYTNPEFDQNSLTEMLGYSKSTAYRKLKSLTGMTISNLIKDVRLKKAREILNKKGGSRISEVAYIVGFNDPKYFSLCFKKEFGMLPSEIEEQ